MSECCCSKKDGNTRSLSCKKCGNRGRPVTIKTIKHMIKEEKMSSLRDAQYFFCATPDCDIVYFSENDNLFYKKDLNVRVGLKEKEEPIPVCYCFGYTRKMILDDIITNERSTIQEKIAQETRKGNCACEVKNPQGICCLGDVSRIIRSFKEAQK